jgi:hypothetical protein
MPVCSSDRQRVAASLPSDYHRGISIKSVVCLSACAIVALADIGVTSIDWWILPQQIDCPAKLSLSYLNKHVETRIFLPVRKELLSNMKRKIRLGLTTCGLKQGLLFF